MEQGTIATLEARVKLLRSSDRSGDRNLLSNAACALAAQADCDKKRNLRADQLLARQDTDKPQNLHPEPKAVLEQRPSIRTFAIASCPSSRIPAIAPSEGSRRLPTRQAIPGSRLNSEAMDFFGGGLGVATPEASGEVRVRSHSHSVTADLSHVVTRSLSLCVEAPAIEEVADFDTDKLYPIASSADSFVHLTTS